MKLFKELALTMIDQLSLELDVREAISRQETSAAEAKASPRKPNVDVEQETQVHKSSMYLRGALDHSKYAHQLCRQLTVSSSLRSLSEHFQTFPAYTSAVVLHPALPGFAVHANFNLTRASI